eukprot:scaffold75120_cov39-Prasinocladus_malaysianus.AAC.1
MKTREYEMVAKCWRKRAKHEPLLPSEQLPSTSSLKLRMDREWLDTFLLVHQGNIARLGKGFSDEEGATLSDNADVKEYLPVNGSESCAAVGSGGSLSGSGQGREIDAHDMVLRVNEAPVDGYQRDVGRHTGMRLINNLWTDKYSKGAPAIHIHLVFASCRSTNPACLL